MVIYVIECHKDLRRVGLIKECMNNKLKLNKRKKLLPLPLNVYKCSFDFQRNY